MVGILRFYCIGMQKWLGQSDYDLASSPGFNVGGGGGGGGGLKKEALFAHDNVNDITSSHVTRL